MHVQLLHSEVPIEHRVQHLLAPLRLLDFPGCPLHTSSYFSVGFHMLIAALLQLDSIDFPQCKVSLFLFRSKVFESELLSPELSLICVADDLLLACSF